MKLTIALLMVAAVVLSTTVTADDHESNDDYMHLPGKSCDDAPPCPDGRPCVMAPPHCNSGTCGTDPVPQCGPKEASP
ncbi:uncharacterized protein LOC105832810 [Monomorium pharaonis]|uniref:uncharacterized protein LOC105832810 n=1 Tax=Monomorium pharaonis TaxID=307658 RepID=UPI00063F9FD3|nr:uncharacterized protein LOC105832810 [Monomorium pharaonis]XP_012529534.1 uncharacterized protein LOC105832810 [Monomorium pharaonis]